MPARQLSHAAHAGSAPQPPPVLGPVVSPVGDRFRYLDHYVYDALLEAIVNGRLVPGTRLVLDDLAEQLKVSRTPIRDALARLTSEGLVRRLGRKGFTLTTLSPVELSDLYDVRLMCELYAVETGIGNATKDLLGQMTELADQGFRSLRGANPLAASLKDREFHRLLVSLSHNPKLATVFEQLNIHIQTLRVRPGQEKLEEQRQHYHMEHLAIVDAIVAGDLATAKEAIRRHIVAASLRAVAALEVSTSAPSPL
jgi:DNA-binding GntR family transcriptional regulator